MSNNNNKTNGTNRNSDDGDDNNPDNADDNVDDAVIATVSGDADSGTNCNSRYILQVKMASILP